VGGGNESMCQKGVWKCERKANEKEKIIFKVAGTSEKWKLKKLWKREKRYPKRKKEVKQCNKQKIKESPKYKQKIVLNK
jgi:hypothetical protein